MGWEDPLEKGMATHSSILAWRIPWTEEPGGLVYGISKSRKQLSDLLSLLTAIYVFVYYKAIKRYLCNICVDNDGGVDTIIFALKLLTKRLEETSNTPLCPNV